MDITNAIETDYVDCSVDDTVSKLVGTFADPSVNGVIVKNEEYEGVITRRQLTTSHHQPDEKLASVVWNVPRLDPDEDIRDASQLMIDSDSRFLPVFDDDRLVGVVTDDSILKEVVAFLDEVTVRDAATENLVELDQDSSIGEALHLFRDNRITHLPVVDDERAIGILSLYDVTELTIRAMDRSQGGDADGTDAFGGAISDSSARTHRGGYGAREGELARILDLPVRDTMSRPVRTIHPDETLQTAVEEMFGMDGASLVVTENHRPAGILTKTDVLDSLTWEAGGNRAVQIFGIELLEDVDYDDVVAMIEKFDDRDHGMSVLDAKIHLHEHDESLRGTPLILVRIRLYTDQGVYIASGEGYGASHALNEAREVLERRIRDRKTHGRNKKPPDEEFWEKRFGWILEP